MKQKTTVAILIFILILTMIYNTKQGEKLELYDEYMSERIGNLIRPAASDIIESKEVLKEIVNTGKINQNQFIRLRIANSTFSRNIGELRYFAQRVIDKEDKYELTPIYISFYRFLEKIEYDAGFSNIDFNHHDPKEKILTDEELEKFKIMENVINEYSNIFINGLGDYKTGELDNSHHLYDREYDVNNERWILVLEEICKFNYHFEYKNEF